MEISVLVLGVLFERMRPDLRVRGWWSRHGWSPAFGTGVPVPTPVALAGFDARRLLLRPTTLLLAYVVFRIVLHPFPRGAYDGVNRTIGFAWAFMGVGALVLVASLAGRDRRQEIVAATPAGERAPVSSWVVLLLGAAVVEYAVAALLRYGHTAPASYAHLLPDAWQLAQVPIMLLGGGLLGLLGARLLPGWVAAPVLTVLAIAWVGVTSNNVPNGTMLAPVIEWVRYVENDTAVIIEPGSFGWHNGYLLGLCALGIVAALLTTPGRRRVLVPLGALALVATVGSAVLAVP